MRYDVVDPGLFEAGTGHEAGEAQPITANRHVGGAGFRSTRST